MCRCRCQLSSSQYSRDIETEIAAAVLICHQPPRGDKAEITLDICVAGGCWPGSGDTIA